jgi:hypothetical protein
MLHMNIEISGSQAAATLNAAKQPEPAFRTWQARAFGAVSAGVGTVAGITPHVLHHIGPIAGAALLTGTQGSVLFGVLGFALTVPMLLRLKKRFGSWAAPAVALSIYAVMFTVSTLWIGPWIRGDGRTEEAPVEDPHHTALFQDVRTHLA